MGFGTGGRQFSGALEAFQPTAAFLLALLCVVTEVGIKREHAQRPANKVHRKPEVGHQALDTLAGTTEPDKPSGLLEAVVVDRGGVLDRENDLLQGTALGRRSLMALENVFHGHPVAGQQTVRRLALGLAREHNRQGCAQMLQPRTAHLDDPLPDATVGMAAASILVIGPVRSLLEIHRSGLFDQLPRCSTKPGLPVRRERLHPDTALRSRCLVPRRHAAGRLIATRPACRGIAGTRVLGSNIGIGHKRAPSVGHLPVIRDARRRHGENRRGQVRDPNPGTNHEPLVANDIANVGHPGIVRPADPGVTRLLMPTCRAKTDDAQNAVDRRTDPVAHLAAGSACPAQRVPGVDHRFPAPPRRVIVDRNKTDPAKILQGTANLAIRNRRSGNGPARWYRRPRCRQRNAQFVRQARQHLARRGRRKVSGTAPPVQAFAQTPCQDAAAGIRCRGRAGQPLYRLGIKLAKTNLHARYVR